MAWSEAARAVDLEARRAHSKSLHNEIKRGVGGVNKDLTIAAYRGLAAKTMKSNRKTLGAVVKGPALHGLMYKTAEAAVRIRKDQFARSPLGHYSKK